LAPPATFTDTFVSFVVPDIPAGVYSVSLQFLNSAGVVVSATNLLVLPVAPVILPFGPGAAVTNALGTLVTVNCKSEVLPNQSVSLALAGTSIPARVFDAPTTTLTFQFPALGSGPYLARLQVDGVDSPITVQWTPPPPIFIGPTLNV
jgi:hypothetical protein